jgi:Big-like domain-containing protein
LPRPPLRKQRVRRLAIAILATLTVALPTAVAIAATDPATEGAAGDARTASDTRIDSGPGGPTANASPSFAFSASLEDATFECSLDSAPFAPCTSPQSYVEIPDGAHSFRVRAVDSSGRPDPTPASRTFQIDTVAPAVAIESGPSGPSNDPLPTFAFGSADGSATLACALGVASSAFAPCPDGGTYRPAAPLPDGDYDFSVRGTDPAGNATTADREFSIDTRPPDVTIQSGPSGRIDDGRPEFAFSSPDPAATFACSTDGGVPSYRPCSGDGSDQPASPLEPGSYTFRVRATDAAGNAAVATRAFEVEAPSPAPRSKADFQSSAPQPVPAWYMTARTERDLKRQARNDVCAFARRQPNKARVLLMDFGKAVRRGGVFGAQLRTGPHFSNQGILDALQAGSDAYRTNGRCYSRGSVRIAYGNTNNMPNWMTRRNIRKAGRRQSRMAHRLEKYQRRKGRRYRHQGVAVAGDIEPQWNRPKATKALVSGAIFHRRGGLYYNYGAASQCPPETSACANHWSIRNLGQVSYGGVKRALPEIYRRVHAKQWTKVRKRWNKRHRYHYCFSGTTATPGFPLSAKEGWAMLRAKNKCVQRELVNIQEQ